MEKEELIQALKETFNPVFENIYARFDSMQGDIYDMRTDINIMKTDINTMKTDIKNIKTDIKNMKTDIKNIDKRLKNVEVEVRKTNLVIENEIRPNIQALRDAHMGNVQSIKDLRKKADNNQENDIFLATEHFKLENEVKKIKRKGIPK